MKHPIQTLVVVVYALIGIAYAINSTRPSLSLDLPGMEGMPGRSIELAHSAWTKMQDDVRFAKNFEERSQEPWHAFGRVVTVYLHPMTPDRRSGVTSDHVYYVELFVVHPGLLTVQTRIDKDAYWVLCRETFTPKANAPVDISGRKAYMSEPEQRKLWRHYHAEIAATYALLQAQF